MPENTDEWTPVVHRLARALDNDDYVAAESLLHPEATYHTGNRTIEGASQIIDSFRTTSESGRARLDSLEFHHRIRDDAPLDIVFIDILRVGNDALRLEHTMHVIIGDDGLVHHLKLEEAPGEKERVERFFERHKR